MCTLKMFDYHADLTLTTLVWGDRVKANGARAGFPLMTLCSEQWKLSCVGHIVCVWVISDMVSKVQLA